MTGVLDGPPTSRICQKARRRPSKVKEIKMIIACFRPQFNQFPEGLTAAIPGISGSTKVKIVAMGADAGFILCNDVGLMVGAGTRAHATVVVGATLAIAFRHQDSKNIAQTRGILAWPATSAFLLTGSFQGGKMTAKRISGEG